MRDKINLLKPKVGTGPVVSLDDTAKWDVYKRGVWAKVEYLNGREFWSAKAANSETSIRFIVRYRTDVTTDMAVMFGTETLDIISATPLGNTRCWTVIIAKEVKPGG
jgi:SPP1 family predicted phage head-tail adaptor